MNDTEYGIRHTVRASSTKAGGGNAEFSYSEGPHSSGDDAWIRLGALTFNASNDDVKALIAAAKKV